MKLQILDRTKKKRILEKLSSFGISKTPLLFIKFGKEKLRAYSGNLSKEEIKEIYSLLPVESIGIYIAKENIKHSEEIRLSIEGAFLFKEQITKNIVFLNEKQEKDWFLGKNIEIGESKANKFVVVKSSSTNDIIGTGKLSPDGKTLFNYLPKERRIKQT